MTYLTPENVLQGLIVLCVVTYHVALGKKKRWGWLLGMSTEALWLGLAWYWQSPLLVVLCVVYAFLRFRNWRHWGAIEDAGVELYERGFSDGYGEGYYDAEGDLMPNEDREPFYVH